MLLATDGTNLTLAVSDNENPQLSTGAPLLQNPGGGASFTVQPANAPDALPGNSSGNTMYLVNSIWSSGSNLVVRATPLDPSERRQY